MFIYVLLIEIREEVTPMPIDDCCDDTCCPDGCC